MKKLKLGGWVIGGIIGGIWGIVAMLLTNFVECIVPILGGKTCLELLLLNPLLLIMVLAKGSYLVFAILYFSTPLVWVFIGALIGYITKRRWKK